MSKLPKYRDGRELGKPRSKTPSPAEMNAAARELWARPGTQLYVAAQAVKLAEKIAVQKKLTGGRQANNEQQASEADGAARNAFREWQKQLAPTVLEGKTLATCVDSYITTKKPSERTKRRLRALLKDGTL
jgi:hypothetical protein